jgi:hypothetical protein
MPFPALRLPEVAVLPTGILGVDWIANIVLRRAYAVIAVCGTGFRALPVLGHGAFIGDYVSWMQTALDSGKTPSGILTA